MGLTRKQTLLKLIVEDFIKTAEPVGSNYLIQKYNLNISSATIRNEMNALEKEGFEKIVEQYKSKINDILITTLRPLLNDILN